MAMMPGRSPALEATRSLPVKLSVGSLGSKSSDKGKSASLECPSAASPDLAAPAALEAPSPAETLLGAPLAALAGDGCFPTFAGAAFFADFGVDDHLPMSVRGTSKRRRTTSSTIAGIRNQRSATASSTAATATKITAPRALMSVLPALRKHTRAVISLDDEVASPLGLAERRRGECTRRKYPEDGEVGDQPARMQAGLYGVKE
mmetsp:Transcript_65083/g.173516  ORF Transcript_65083/g.173516 Transcript_65083/m.173516 type:complete len:204 (+) Transcript_65083:2221-2832(+)